MSFSPEVFNEFKEVYSLRKNCSDLEYSKVILKGEKTNLFPAVSLYMQALQLIIGIMTQRIFKYIVPLHNLLVGSLIECSMEIRLLELIC